MTADIQLVDIEAELTRLWESRQEKDHIKACLCTLVVYIPDQDHALFLKKMVHSFIEKFPCRIIFIQGLPANEDNSLRVSVSNAIVGVGKVSITCDQISIDVGKKQVHRVPFIVLPHLVADLPIYFLWGQDPTTEKDILPKLQKYATRLIFDTSGVADLKAFSQRMQVLLDSQHNLGFMDMNWARIHGWRQVLSQVFDTQDKSLQLRYSKTIQINYNGRTEGCFKQSEMQVMYLVGWLAAQMQWKLVDSKQNGNQRCLSYNNGKNKLVITLSPQSKADLPSGEILEVEIVGGDEKMYSFLPVCNLPKVVVHISTDEKCELPFVIALPDLKRSSSMIKTILYHETSAHYKHMLQAVEAIG
jgi:glucose-6-phosphate dehydrogenase assembly protein OpcA